MGAQTSRFGGGQPPSAGPGLQHAFDQFSAACNQAGTKISSKRIEALCLLRRPRQCILQVSGNILQQVETFKYLGVVFTSDGSRNKEIDTANQVLRELYCSVVTKRELLKTAKLSVFKSVFLQIFICGHESYVTTESTFKRTNGGDGIFAKSSRCETSWQRAQVWNPQSQGCQATSPNREIPATSVRLCVQNAAGKIGETRPAGNTHGKAAQRSSKDQVAWPRLRPYLVPSWCVPRTTEIAVDREAF